VEAEKRLTALPRAYYNKAANEPSNLTALLYYRSAAAAPDLTERANKQAVLREKAFLAEARDRLIAGDDTLEDELNFALKILGQHPRVLFLKGRFLVMRSRFEDALPIWQKLLALAPDDDKAKLELQRCQDKLGLADV
jgi:tetratricopeptide (TPR) repeat protein